MNVTAPSADPPGISTGAPTATAPGKPDTKKKPPLRVAVVGANLWGAMMAWELSKREELVVSWHATDKDRARADDGAWALLPHNLDSTLDLGDLAHPIDEVYFFAGGEARASLADFRQDRAQGVWREVHPAVRQRCFSLGLWNDLTPSMWTSRWWAPWWNRREPNSQWPRQAPLSASSHSRFAPMLVPLDRCLARMRELLAARGVNVSSEDKVVLGLQPGGRSVHRLVQNAPFGAFDADRVVWTSTVAPLREEGARSRRPVPRAVQPLARWQSVGAWVEGPRVAALPLLSVWLDPSASDLFLHTGLLESGNLKRVLCLPPTLHGKTGEARHWLQIQSLNFLDSPAGELAASERAGAGREAPGEFLWRLCPYLRNDPAVLKQEWIGLAPRDEEQFFGQPRPQRYRYGRGVQFWSPGSTDRLPQSSKQLAAQL